MIRLVLLVLIAVAWATKRPDRAGQSCPVSVAPASDLVEAETDAAVPDLLSRLPQELIAMIGDLLDLKSLLELRAVNQIFRSALKPWSCSFVYDPDLHHRVRHLAQHIGNDRELQVRFRQHMTETEFVKLFDRATALRLTVDQTGDLCAALESLETYNPVLRGLTKNLQMYLDVYRQIGVNPEHVFRLRVTSRDRLQMRIPQSVVDHICTDTDVDKSFYGQLCLWFQHENRIELLTQTDVLIDLLLGAGIRIPLFIYLVFVPVTHSGLEVVFPLLEETLWGYPRLYRPDGRVNWHFFIQIDFLVDEGRHDAAAAVLRLPAVSEYFRDQIADIILDLDAESLDLLCLIQCPLLPDILCGRAGPTQDTALHVACKRDDSELVIKLLSVLNPSDIVRENALGHVPFHYLSWNKVADLAPDAVALWRQADPKCVALRHYEQISGDFSHFTNCADFLELLVAEVDHNRDHVRALFLFASCMNQPNVPTISTPNIKFFLDLQQRLRELDAAQFELDQPEHILEEAVRRCPDFLSSTVNHVIDDARYRFAILHFAFYERNHRLILLLLSVPGINVHLKDGKGHVPFHYVTPALLKLLLREASPHVADLVRSDLAAFLYAARGICLDKDGAGVQSLLDNVALFHYPNRLDFKLTSAILACVQPCSGACLGRP